MAARKTRSKRSERVADVATVLLDTRLRIKRFTTSAASPFILQSSDVGRSIERITTNLPGVDLEARLPDDSRRRGVGGT